MRNVPTPTEKQLVENFILEGLCSATDHDVVHRMGCDGACEDCVFEDADTLRVALEMGCVDLDKYIDWEN
jgi:hypothetical protein